MVRLIHRNEERGGGEFDWLKSKFSFSFSDYYNPNRMGFGKLRVLNDDIIAPNMGFGMHPHKDMEIITIVNEGKLEHKDSLGNKEIITPGIIQVMSAGRGIVHSEINASDKEDLKLFQIWIEPNKKDHLPRHDEINFNFEENSITQIVGGEENKDYLFINQDANLFILNFEKDNIKEFNFSKEKGVFIFVIEGKIKIYDIELNNRDSLEITNEEKININFLDNSRVLIIEVPM
jgi:redox-sensitive bicupin YhaK (pirin superfamily)